MAFLRVAFFAGSTTISTSRSSSAKPGSPPIAASRTWVASLAGPRAGDQGGHLLLLDHLPVDERLDVRVVGLEHDHLGRPARGTARLDGPRGAVADAEERHEARGSPAARQGLVLAAQVR